MLVNTKKILIHFRDQIILVNPFFIHVLDSLILKQCLLEINGNI